MRRYVLNQVDKYFILEDLKAGRLQLGMIDKLIHMSFARPYKGNEEIAASLQAPLTRKLFQEEIANVALHKFREEVRKPQMRTKKWVGRVKG